MIEKVHELNVYSILISIIKPIPSVTIIIIIIITIIIIIILESKYLNVNTLAHIFYRSQNASVPFSLPSLHAAPTKLLLGLYERTFFSDNKLGTLDLPLSSLSENR